MHDACSTFGIFGSIILEKNMSLTDSSCTQGRDGLNSSSILFSWQIVHSLSLGFINECVKSFSLRLHRLDYLKLKEDMLKEY